ncbi:antirestriction protein [Burkholderia ubonensis]|uniref:antirestriction protein n=1 Tax=Burkholderia ubonensis TaxID=101571 RepID=UPI000757BE09|nr:antirestriction protein [Burkholderia ubonensis]KWE97895.1 antirestriction protein [Burkholderia ubonensis]
MEANENKVLSELVVEELRAKFLPLHFGTRYIQGESFLFDWASRLSSEYNGGYWHFFNLSNGGFYAAPEMKGPVEVVYPLNHYEGKMGAEAFGIVVTLYALCHMAEIYGDDRYIARYHALRAFAVQHPEQAEIFRAID